MALSFPKDEELFEDLEGIEERSRHMNDYLDALAAQSVEDPSSDAYKNFMVQSQLIADNYYNDEVYFETHMMDFDLNEYPEYIDIASEKKLKMDRMKFDIENDEGLFSPELFGNNYFYTLLEENEFNNNKIYELKTESDFTKISLRLHRDFMVLQNLVYLHAMKPLIGFFPDSSATTYETEKGPVQFDYFKDMNKYCNIFQPGAFNSLDTALDNIKKAENNMSKTNTDTEISSKSKGFSIFSLYFVLLGGVLLLAGGESLPMVPDFLTAIINSSFVARLLVSVPLALTGLLIIFFAGIIMEDDSEFTFLMKLIGNGIVALIAGIGSILCALTNLFMPPVETFEMIVLGMFYILYGICAVIDEATQQKKANKKKGAAEQAKRQAEIDLANAKAEFCTLVKEEIYSLHRYLRFHVLWWQTINPKKPLPSGINELQKSFDHIVAMYDKYKD